MTRLFAGAGGGTTTAGAGAGAAAGAGALATGGGAGFGAGTGQEQEQAGTGTGAATGTGTGTGAGGGTTIGTAPDLAACACASSTSTVSASRRACRRATSRCTGSIRTKASIARRAPVSSSWSSARLACATMRAMRCAFVRSESFCWTDNASAASGASDSASATSASASSSRSCCNAWRALDVSAATCRSSMRSWCARRRRSRAGWRGEMSASVLMAASASSSDPPCVASSALATASSNRNSRRRPCSFIRSCCTSGFGDVPDSSFCSSPDAVVSSPCSIASAASRSISRRDVVTSRAGGIATVGSDASTTSVWSGSRRRAMARNSRSRSLALSARAAGSLWRHFAIVLISALGTSGAKLSIGRGCSPTMRRET